MVSASTGWAHEASSRLKFAPERLFLPVTVQRMLTLSPLLQVWRFWDLSNRPVADKACHRSGTTSTRLRSVPDRRQ